jgi:hypothetical protein
MAGVGPSGVGSGLRAGPCAGATVVAAETGRGSVGTRADARRGFGAEGRLPAASLALSSGSLRSRAAFGGRKYGLSGVDRGPWTSASNSGGAIVTAKNAVAPRRGNSPCGPRLRAVIARGSPTRGGYLGGATAVALWGTSLRRTVLVVTVWWRPPSTPAAAPATSPSGDTGMSLSSPPPQIAAHAPLGVHAQPTKGPANGPGISVDDATLTRSSSPGTVHSRATALSCASICGQRGCISQCGRHAMPNTGPGSVTESASLASTPPRPPPEAWALSAAASMRQTRSAQPAATASMGSRVAHHAIWRGAEPASSLGSQRDARGGE